MGYINIFLSNPCKLFIKNEQLIVGGELEHSFPLEDINSVLIETLECNISSYTLEKFVENGTIVYLCDNKHLPNGVILPYNCFYRKQNVLKLQFDISKPLQKRLWQSIVKRKIENQAKCLELTTNIDTKVLYDLSKKVSSDDAGNCEATAANLYFKRLFGGDFVRRDDSFTNSALNYGYALLRGLIARTLVVYGFEPSIGLHHENEFNTFNLADDMIEPFRPIVDLYVFNLLGYSELNSNVKKQLFSILNQDVEIEGQVFSLSYGVEKVVQSLKNSIVDNKVEICLPNLLPIKSHKYE